MIREAMTLTGEACREVMKDLRDTCPDLFGHPEAYGFFPVAEPACFTTLRLAPLLPWNAT